MSTLASEHTELVVSSLFGEVNQRRLLAVASVQVKSHAHMRNQDISASRRDRRTSRCCAVVASHTNEETRRIMHELN